MENTEVSHYVGENMGFTDTGKRIMLVGENFSREKIELKYKHQQYTIQRCKD